MASPPLSLWRWPSASFTGWIPARRPRMLLLWLPHLHVGTCGSLSPRRPSGPRSKIHRILPMEEQATAHDLEGWETACNRCDRACGALTTPLTVAARHRLPRALVSALDD